MDVGVFIFVNLPSIQVLAQPVQTPGVFIEFFLVLGCQVVGSCNFRARIVFLNYLRCTGAVLIGRGRKAWESARGSADVLSRCQCRATSIYTIPKQESLVSMDEHLRQ
jgi:hypothetical protein